jgi:hypothetical protein
VTADRDPGGVTGRGFELVVDGERVPGLLWAPAAAVVGGPRPTVLIGHGRGSHKRADYVVRMACRLVLDRGWAVPRRTLPATVTGSNR